MASSLQGPATLPQTIPQPAAGPQQVMQGNMICFCGAGGTGKTTTATLLMEMLKHMGYEFLPSASREVFKRHGVLTEDDQLALSPLQRWALQKDIQQAHANNVVQNWSKKLLSDRSQLDQFVYALQYCGTYINHADMQWLQRLTSAALLNYGAVIYFPLTSWTAGIKDGMRTEAVGQRYAFDLMLQATLEYFNVPFLRLPIDTPINRVTDILRYLLERGLLPNKHLSAAHQKTTINTLREAMK